MKKLMRQFVRLRQLLLLLLLLHMRQHPLCDVERCIVVVGVALLITTGVPSLGQLESCDGGGARALPKTDNHRQRHS